MKPLFSIMSVCVLAVFSKTLIAQCPQSSDPTLWQQWQTQRTLELFKTQFQPKKAKEIKDEINECQNSSNIPSPIQACTQNLRRFANSKSWEIVDGHSLGASLSDEDYESKAPFPEMLELPKELAENQEFLTALDERSIPSAPPSYNKAFAIIDKINNGISDPNLKWIPFIYDSQHLPTPDGTDSMGRFFIYIPYPDYDRFVQFGIQRDPELPLSPVFSCVSIQKTDPLTHKPLKTPRGRIKDFWRLKDKDGKITISTRLKVMGKLENCYDCHKNFLLPIYPDPKTFDKARFQKSVDRVNEAMLSLGYIIADGYDHEANGPAMGTETSNRTDEFIRACSKGSVTEAQRIQKVKDSMNCTQCHDGLYRGTLNFPSGIRKLPVSPNSRWGSLIDHFVINHKAMPPDENDLSDIERKAVASCLKAEYYEDFKGQPGLFKTWFLQKDCWDSNR